VFIHITRILLLLGLALIGFLRSSSLLFVILIRFNVRLKLTGLYLRLAGITLVHILVVWSVSGHAKLQSIGVLVCKIERCVELVLESLEIIHIHQLTLKFLGEILRLNFSHICCVERKKLIFG